MNLLKEKKDLGVIICRMQVPHLTDSHKALIDTVLQRHPRVTIFLGCTGKPIEEKNPFPFLFRKRMIEMAFGNKNLSIVPHMDVPDNNADWVSSLDRMVDAFLNYDETALLYGGRESFIPYYTKEKGKFETKELAPNDYDSGTKLRELTELQLPDYTPESAQAILWTIRQIKGHEGTTIK